MAAECGVGACKKVPCLKYLANKTMFVIVYGALGCVISASYAYSKATITTIEKRFKIPTKMSGVISTGNDVSSFLVTLLLSYYAGNSHRPRWIALGVYCVASYCFLTSLPHAIWGPGEDALSLTLEHGAIPDGQISNHVPSVLQRFRSLCTPNVTETKCSALEDASSDSSMAPVLILFFAQFVSGLGNHLFFTLGLSYLDDNTEKAKSPLLISVSYFFRLLGPTLGFSLGSYFLRIYVAPNLSPVITNSDPRWIGAWWAGWLVLGSLLILLGTLIGMFPRALPASNQRKATDKRKHSFLDMKITILRIIRNKIFILNLFSSMLYSFGFMPFWAYKSKYLEVQYQITASLANFFTGSVALACSAAGILLSGIGISILKPKARSLAAWNVFLSVLAITAILSFPHLGCEQSDARSLQMVSYGNQECSDNCSCEFVKYSPVCSEDGRTFISACHAGCKNRVVVDGKTIFSECSCISGNHSSGGRAYPGPCPVDCSSRLHAFITMMCLMTFCTSAGRASNMLVAVRCVDEKDKAVSLGIDVMLFNLFVYIPAPILYGFIMDSTCVLWGQTCSRKGNCWQYDGEYMRTLLNYMAAGFVTLGTLLDVAVWYNVKYLKIFEEKVNKNETELLNVQNTEN